MKPVGVSPQNFSAPCFPEQEAHTDETLLKTAADFEEMNANFRDIAEELNSQLQNVFDKPEPEQTFTAELFRNQTPPSSETKVKRNLSADSENLSLIHI